MEQIKAPCIRIELCTNDQEDLLGTILWIEEDSGFTLFTTELGVGYLAGSDLVDFVTIWNKRAKKLHLPLQISKDVADFAQELGGEELLAEVIQAAV